MSVYFARAGNMMKIGCSRKPLRRVKEIGEWIPFEIELVAATDGSYDLEAAIHNHFADSWSHLEWFRVTPEMEAMVDDINAGRPITLRPWRKDTLKMRRTTLKKRASRRITMAEKRAGIKGFYSLRGRPDYLLEAIASFRGPHKPPPSAEALAAIARYERECAARSESEAA